MIKNKNGLTYLVLAILCVWVPMFMGAWDKDKPASSTSLRSSNPEILANQSALETSFGAHHEFSTGGTNSGNNLRIKFDAPISTPTNAANIGWVYSKDVSAVVEMHWLDESGNEIQLTSAGNILSSSLDMKDEDDMTSDSATHAATQQSIKAYGDSGTQTMTNKTLTSPVINTAISGTAFLDEDDMSSDSATKVASQQSIKAFVNTNRTGWTPTIATGYAGEDSITFPNGMIWKHGTESVAANTTDEVTYPVAFPGGFTISWVSFKAKAVALTDVPNSQPKSGSETTILEVTNGHTSTQNINWFAIGF